MVRCADNSLYTGIALDVERRLAEHNGKGAARYTRSRQPVKLAYSETVDSRSAASSREIAIKRLSKAEKEALIENNQII
jgi:putative endonuclease